MKRVFFAFITALLLTNCAQVNEFSGLSQSYSGPVAHINDSSSKVSLIKQHFYELAAVNDKHVYASSTCTQDGGNANQQGLSLCSQRHEVPAGKQRLNIRAVNYVTVPFFSFFNNIYKAEGSVLVNLEVGEEYFVKGNIDGDKAAVWVEDARGDMVSAKIESR
ncbi:Uncharacterised protein [Zhongshania aliphaticivorans]|uniref:Lipoprotein n=1 Tax=Zhongshania aliphaticivorans TaxID=1470434 RepID=A0A5S9QLD7_9GAMM|nr:hypothetical protein [Zhongshania aliphaticivorans]CAA0111549.1 Uncharacterised protein [Zhongshania aliphaticivorans]CAA0118689.1 Uncharacterised protein [Zhongshania aliphaticivorans]